MDNQVSTVMNNTHKPCNLCHITTEYGALGIINEGIRCDWQGYIYMFENGLITTQSGLSLPMSDTVAISLGKVQERHYFNFSIDPKGITSEFETTDYTGFASGYHWRIRQDVIPKEFIKIIDWRAASRSNAFLVRNHHFAEKLGIAYSGQTYKELYRMILERESPELDVDNVFGDQWDKEWEPYSWTFTNKDLIMIRKLRDKVFELKRPSKVKASY